MSTNQVRTNTLAIIIVLSVNWQHNEFYIRNESDIFVASQGRVPNANSEGRRAMQTEPYLPINFTISPEAWAEIENIRRSWDSKFEDKADVLVIAWGRTILNDGRSWSHVVVSFYGVSERHKAERAIQMLSGREVVFFTTPEFYDKFEGKIIRFAPDKWFFLAPH